MDLFNFGKPILLLLVFCTLNVQLEAKVDATSEDVSSTTNFELKETSTSVLEVTTSSNYSDSENETTLVFRVEDPRHCGDKLNVLQVLPGQGFDNLQSKTVSNIVQFNYSQCSKTSDGKFLIPDGFIAVTPHSDADPITSTVFYTMEDYYQAGTESLTHDPKMPSNATTGGSFSEDYQRTKTRQIVNDAITVRVQYREVQYEIQMSSNELTLTNEFKAAVKDIVDSLTIGDDRLTHYYADYLIGKFGTHFVNSVQAGGMVVKEDDVKSAVVEKGEKLQAEELKLAAETIFMRQFQEHENNGTTDKKLEDLITNYKKYIVSSSTTSFGGAVQKPLFIDDWKTTLDGHLAIVDQSGSSLSDILTVENFPQISESSLNAVKEEMQKSVNRYYSHNTHFGCTDRKSSNFVFMANKDDGSCDGPATNYSFGGMYQTCENVDKSEGDANDYCRKSGLRRPNPLTRGLSCPQNYSAVPLYVKIAEHDTRQCTQACSDDFECVNFCRMEPSNFFYNLYWCAPDVNSAPGSGAMFGGVYSKRRINPVTGGTSCPVHFTALRFGDTHVCISTNGESSQYAVPFGGFFSSMTGNPFSASENHEVSLSEWQHRCPAGYSKHTAGTDGADSYVSYCIAAGGIEDHHLPLLVKPPYTDKPKSNTTSEHMVVFIDEANDVIWYRSSISDKWKNATSVEELRAAGLVGLASYLYQPAITDSTNVSVSAAGNGSSSGVHGVADSTKATPAAGNGLSGGVIAGIVIGALVLVAAIVGATYFYGKKRQQSRQRTDSRSNLTSSENAPRDYSSSQRSNDSHNSQTEASVNDTDQSPA